MAEDFDEQKAMLDKGNWLIRRRLDFLLSELGWVRVPVPKDRSSVNHSITKGWFSLIFNFIFNICPYLIRLKD